MTKKPKEFKSFFGGIKKIGAKGFSSFFDTNPKDPVKDENSRLQREIELLRKQKDSK